MPEWFPGAYVMCAIIAFCLMYLRDQRRRSDPEYYKGMPAGVSMETLEKVGPLMMGLAAVLWPLALVGFTVKGIRRLIA